MKGIQYSELVILIIIFQENGHVFTIESVSKQVFGTIALVSADNPASSALGGFKESGSALHCCRHCMGTSDEITVKVSVNYCYLFV